jgi:hypothetical protein
MDGLKEVGKRHGIPVLVQGTTGAFNPYFTDRAPSRSQACR